MLLEIKGLEASIEGKEILKGVNLSIPPGSRFILFTCFNL
jgi:Fe-S cluster assembly ATPase SufC